MKLVVPQQMNMIDLCAINEYGIPGVLLMENAAKAVAEKAKKMLADSKRTKVSVLAGCGNNGGDAFAAARLLKQTGVDVNVYLVGEKERIKADALVNYNILSNLGIKVTEIQSETEFGQLCQELYGTGLIIDGIFGTGLARDVDGMAKRVIETVNASGKSVLSIDIPSGIDGATGEIKGVCINADATVTFCLPKLGLIQNPGCEYTGKLIISDIGIPSQAIDKQNITTELIDQALVFKMLPPRPANSNKGDFGRVLIVTGSTGMTGSGCLASMASLRSGGGLVYAAVPASLAGIYGSALIEPIILPLEDKGMGTLLAQSTPKILEYMERMDVAAVGPGLTVTADIEKIVREIIAHSTIPLILDADALNAISQDAAMLRKLKAKAVLTPHPGEMARLTGLSIEQIQKDRISVAKSFSQEYGIVVVLKGSKTVVALPDGRVFINPTGNSGMASAGTGDVLTGMIAGLCAQGMDLDEAAVAGVYLHGMAGDLAAEELGKYSMVASDIIKYLPKAFKSGGHNGVQTK
jgi:hydroxyethylthiazole kinase-like uncharacterized protein yjeF